MATSSPAVFFFTALSLAWIACGQADAEKPRLSPRSSRQPVLSLDFKNNGQHLAARVGQQIELTLGTIGPKEYGDPLISSDALKLESVALDWPPNPGGTRFIYIFEATSEGEAQVNVPIINCDPCPDPGELDFRVTILVGPKAGKPSAMQILLRPDQANTAPWAGAWTNLFNVLRQTFTPSLRRLTGVEVEMAVANPGPKSADLTLTVMDKEGVPLAVVSKTVPLDDCSHVLFILPRGGLTVSPGQAYSIGLSTVDSPLGWKYVVGGYRNGNASFNGRPLLPNAHSTFLFRTFGTSWETRR